MKKKDFKCTMDKWDKPNSGCPGAIKNAICDALPPQKQMTQSCYTQMLKYLYTNLPTSNRNPCDSGFYPSCHMSGSKMFCSCQKYDTYKLNELKRRWNCHHNAE